MIEGLIHTGIVYRKAEASDNYGGVTSTLTSIITGWRCRISEDFSMYAREQRGRGGREIFDVVGENNATPILRGDILVIDSVSFEVVSIAHRNTDVSSHHWYLKVERMMA